MSTSRILAAVAALADKMESSGYGCEYRATVRRRGWPERSARPFHLFNSHGEHLAAFASLAALETNWRARAAC